MTDSLIHDKIVSWLEDEFSVMTLAIVAFGSGDEIKGKAESEFGGYPESWIDAAIEDAKTTARSKLHEQVADSHETPARSVVQISVPDPPGYIRSANTTTYSAQQSISADVSITIG